MGFFGKWEDHKRRITSPLGVFLILATIVVAGIFIPCMTIGIEYYRASSTVIAELAAKLDELQSTVNTWQASGKTNFQNLNIQAWLNNNTDISPTITLTGTTEPSTEDKFVQLKSGITYDVYRYTIEVTYPPANQNYNNSGVYQGGLFQDSIISPEENLAKTFNYSKSDIDGSDLYRFSWETNFTLNASTYIKICNYRYHGVWNSNASICTVTTYADNLCFVGNSTASATRGYGCYYNTRFFWFNSR